MSFQENIPTAIISTILVFSLAISIALLPKTQTSQPSVKTYSSQDTTEKKVDKKEVVDDSIDLLFFTLQPKHIGDLQTKSTEDTTKSETISISPKNFTESENYFQKAILDSNPELCKKITDSVLRKRCQSAFFSNKSSTGLESFLLKLTTW